MAFPHLENVANRWRPLFFIVGGTLCAVGTGFFCVQVRSILMSGAMIVSERGAHWGKLPDFLVCGTGGDVEFGYYNVKLVGGMELGNSVWDVPVYVKERTETIERQWPRQKCLHVDTSTVTLPRFSLITQHYPAPAKPMIYLRLLYSNKDGNAYQTKNLEMFAESEGGQELVGLFASTSLYDGTVSEHTEVMSKSADVWLLTRDLLNWEGMKRHFTVMIQRFRFRATSFPKTFVNLRCRPEAFLHNGSEDFFGDQRGGVVGNFTGGCVPKEGARDSTCPEDGPCSRVWKLIYVSVAIEDESVLILQRRGAVLRLLQLVCSFGGLLSLASALLACVFVRKNREHEMVKLYDEVTFVGEGQPWLPQRRGSVASVASSRRASMTSAASSEPAEESAGAGL